jgi:hypothetical protein
VYYIILRKIVNDKHNKKIEELFVLYYLVIGKYGNLQS